MFILFHVKYVLHSIRYRNQPGTGTHADNTGTGNIESVQVSDFYIFTSFWLLQVRIS